MTVRAYALQVRRGAWRLVRAVSAFAITVTLVIVLDPGFLPELSFYMKAPQRAGAIDPAQLYHPRPGDPQRFGRTGPNSLALGSIDGWSWQRLAEVAEGRRAFGPEDYETQRRQLRDVARFTEFWSLDPFWRAPHLALSADTPLDLAECLAEVTALTFHLDGLDAHGELARHAAVFEAGLLYIEELATTGLGRRQPLTVLAMAADERLLRHALRHARLYPPDALQIAALTARLTEHFRRVGDLRDLLAKPHLVRINEFLLAAPEARWPRRIPLDPESWGLITEVQPSAWESELAVLRAALALDARAGLALVVEHALALERARLEPMSPGRRLRGLLLGDRSVLFRPRDLELAHGAYVRQLEWSALRRGTLEALLRLTPGCKIALRHAPGPFALSDDPLTVHTVGRDGRDEHGAGDDMPIWPPAAVSSAAPEPGAAASFPGPEAALTRLICACEHRGLNWQVAQVTRPEGGLDLQRARAEVMVSGERFASLGGLLTQPDLCAIGSRGEMVQTAGTHRALRYDVTLARQTGMTHGAPIVLRVAASDVGELARELAHAIRGRFVERLVVVRLPRGLECTAVARATGTSGATDTRRASR